MRNTDCFSDADIAMSEHGNKYSCSRARRYEILNLYYSLAIETRPRF